MTNLEFMQSIKEREKAADEQGIIPVRNVQEKLLLIIAEETIKTNERLYDMKRTLESIELMIRQIK